ncbi:ATP-dependent nuclease [Brevibacillus sp. 179-C9.3 HS]|uniref:ATP-dependent nuclease n=1 Tax=unclassified Brevibacillus TaxID=2684853 RepID=UPI00399F24CA
MKLSRITISNFRRIEYADIHLSPTSFIIGPNNIGKTTLIKAIDALLSLTNDKVKPEDFRTLADGTRSETIEICGYFTDIDSTTANSRGFKGRVVDGSYVYKKTYSILSKTPEISTVQYNYKISDEFNQVKKWADLIQTFGYSEQDLKELLEISSRPQNDVLPKGWELKIDGAVEWNFESKPQEVKNPGGIPSIVASKLPRLIHIPSYTNVSDIGKAESKTLLGECLGILFDDLLSQSELAAGIQSQLELLQQEMAIENEGSMIFELCQQVNRVIGEVFPNCGISISPSLNELSSVLKPQYTVEMFSNVNTDAERQGTGLVRTGIFAMLRYHSHLKLMGGFNTRPLLVAFEEPEIYLHPSAANLLRDTIYTLGESDQIICTTHSPWMIDLSKDWQSLTKLQLNSDSFTNAINYGLSEATRDLHDDERDHLNMIKTFDDELSRIFFSEKCIVVEGDSEVVAIKNALKWLNPDVRKEILSKVQVIKARGKAAIIPIVKYLKALQIPFHVIHDRDSGTEGAEKFNQPILNVVEDPAKISVLEECLENCLGYKAPSSNKPYRTYIETSKWTCYEDIPEAWANVLKKAFNI